MKKILYDHEDVFRLSFSHLINEQLDNFHKEMIEMVHFLIF